MKYRPARDIQKFAGRKKETAQQRLPPISIIICARNEAENLKTNIPFILAQDYPSDLWEVVIVDDASSDDTRTVLNQFQKDASQLKTISIPPGATREFPGKKQALHIGILSASFPTVLLTDADCRPASLQWLRCMATALIEQDKKIILGYGAYSRGRGLLNKMVQWETLHTCIQYMGMAISGMPYMGVGRNLMYQKALYWRVIKDPGFLRIYKSVPYGDDDLLLAHICTQDNTGLCLQPGSFTISDPEKTVGSWLDQKSRHLSTGKFYPRDIKTVLGLSALTQGLFWLLWPLLLACPVLRNEQPFEKYLWAGIAAFGIIRLGLYWRNAQKWYVILGNRRLWSFYPFGEIGQSVLQFVLSPYIFRKNKKQWKS
ncbi:MAG TPA: glycosyltransferase [Edaphocola sp.]|nr:glycosyltransferase [Edaphocola sp.]